MNGNQIEKLFSEKLTRDGDHIMLFRVPEDSEIVHVELTIPYQGEDLHMSVRYDPPVRLDARRAYRIISENGRFEIYDYENDRVWGDSRETENDVDRGLIRAANTRFWGDIDGQLMTEQLDRMNATRTADMIQRTLEGIVDQNLDEPVGDVETIRRIIDRHLEAIRARGFISDHDDGWNPNGR